MDIIQRIKSEIEGQESLIESAVRTKEEAEKAILTAKEELGRLNTALQVNMRLLTGVVTATAPTPVTVPEKPKTRRPSGHVKLPMLEAVAKSKEKVQPGYVVRVTGLPSDSIRPAMKDAKNAGELHCEKVDGKHLYSITQKGLESIKREQEKQRNAQEANVAA